MAGQQGAKGYQFGANRQIAGILIQMGDIAQAEALSAPQPDRNSRRRGPAAIRHGAPSYDTYGQSWEAEIELGRAMMAEARGQFRDAEAAYRVGEQRRRAAMKRMLQPGNSALRVQPGARGSISRCSARPA